MTKNNKAVRITTARFIVEDDLEIEFLMKFVVEFMTPIYMEYTSQELASEAIEDSIMDMFERISEIETPSVVQIEIERPIELRGFPKPGKKTKARRQYFETTCETTITVKPLNGHALGLYQSGQKEAAILEVFPTKKGA